MSTEYRDRSFSERAGDWFGHARRLGKVVGEGIISREDPSVAAFRTAIRVRDIIEGTSRRDFWSDNPRQQNASKVPVLGHFLRASIIADDAVEMAYRIPIAVAAGFATDLAVLLLNPFTHMGRILTRRE